ncbi:uncharacterized protein LOC119078066 isoform X2 [Bradysia coprophila]|uniref:uncharacterized protein LOC119078066 isoform X2 n=1 Tax=Bradysia coprophila TaxID=38358 RepID=UPI00187D9227|nr:uncharacterized protein LOC119078066 isoform X2 [Bradysia coprophila]
MKMIKLRRISKYHVGGVIAIAALYFIVVMLGEPKEYTDNKLKLEIVENLIHSNDNQQSCRIPHTDIYAPEMMKFIKDDDPLIDCGTEEDWVSCTKSICFIRSNVIAKLGTIVCDFADIFRIDDYTIRYGEPVRSSTMYILRRSDFAKAKCWTENSEYSWSGIIYGIRRVLKRDQIYHHDPTNINVLMYGFDSLSKNAFIRKLPKTYDYLTQHLKGDVLQGYNIVGDGTPQALIPILTGFTELELPETRKRMKGSKSVNVYPMIWSEYERSGYVTSFNEDVPHIGTFSYRLNGFDQQPTDHYMRTFYLAIDPELANYKKLCVGSQPRHNVMLDYTKEFMQSYTVKPRFVFSFHGELSHDSINLIGVADNDIKNWLTDLQSSGVLNSTILILMSDHGNRFAAVRNTLQGKLEERLPFFSFVFPEWFKTKHSRQYQNFRDNLNTLSTPFDVHATLEDILRLQSTSFDKIKKPMPKTRSISLFDKIPKNRSCADAYIEPHWCVCMNWHQINDTQNEFVLRAARSVIDAINHFTEKDQDKCARLYLHEIKWAAKLAPHDNLMRFKQNKDVDGFLADLTSKTKVSSEMYQVKIVVKPGKSIFEASVLHDLNENVFRVKMSDISRVNKYGSQAECILDTDPELRKYCYCKERHID